MMHTPPRHLPIRAPAVAGAFYPAAPAALRAAVAECLRAVPASAALTMPAQAPKAIIVPHAGYVYSGTIAARAYAALAPAASRIRRVVLLGPAHRVAFAGMAVPAAGVFATPLGEIPVDGELVARAARLPQVLVSDVPHAEEHSLEVQLPFLQTVLPSFTLLPVVVGDADAAAVGRLIDALWGGDETLLVISSDLSHFHRYDEARRIDGATVARILAGDEELEGEEACGAMPINGLNHALRARGLHAELLAQCNSGDTAGDRQRVVGYAAFAVREANAAAAGDARH